MSDSLSTIPVLVKIESVMHIAWKSEGFYAHHAKCSRPFYHVPKQGSFIAQKASIGQDTPEQLSCSRTL
jgi:hypothetical protein